MLKMAVELNAAIQGSSWPKDKPSLVLLKDMAMALWKSENLGLAIEALESLHELSVHMLERMDNITIWVQSQIRSIQDREAKNFQNGRCAVVASSGSKQQPLTSPAADLLNHSRDTPSSSTEEHIPSDNLEKYVLLDELEDHVLLDEPEEDVLLAKLGKVTKTFGEGSMEELTVLRVLDNLYAQ